MNIKILPIAILLLITIPAITQEDTLSEPHEIFQAGYISDWGRNFTGGTSQSNFYIGKMDICVILDFNSLGWWKNGEAYFQVQNTHGISPNGNYTNDLQVFSNIDNGDFTYLYMALYKHTFGNLSVTTGIHDLNSEFIFTEVGALFTNSSFGIMPTSSMNIPVPIFPKNALGLVLMYEFSENWTFKTSLYDGDPLSLDDDPWNMNLDIDPQKEGLLHVSELQYHHLKNNTLKASYKLGVQYHTGEFGHFTDSGSSNGNFTLYYIEDYKVNDQLDYFLQIGWGPEKKNALPLYLGTGFNYTGLGSRENDILGLAVAYAGINSKLHPVMEKNEIALELDYQLYINENFNIQPVIQEIIHPGGAQGADNILLGYLRFNIGF